MAVNHQHLRAFHAVATDGSVSRAARRLNVAQPTLSQQLKALEERHQTPLFEGRKPPLRLTAAGRQLFTLTQKLFATSDDIDDLLGDSNDPTLSSLRLGSDCPIYAARFAKALRQKHSAMGIQVRVGNARETIRALGDAQIDAGIVSDPPGDNVFAYEPLYVDRLMVALPAHHPCARDIEFSLAQLGNERLLLREASSRTRAATERLLSQADVVPSDVIELHTRETIREGVAIGLGVSLFISLECPPDSRIAYLPLAERDKAHHLTGYIVCLAERRRTRLLRSVMETARDLRGLSPMMVFPGEVNRPPNGHGGAEVSASAMRHVEPSAATTIT
ncbi:MAG: LysR family transcriptional regulator [Alphaproteobacteria bacterium]|nr:LysR family transcriptional regulator [Alphaproteobacteria bacterium]MBL6937027.1 LysR family transcriptional regulator [Alphaproteobacteria bacterium]MBL7097796.1 LysR family transcriptional regulator [Alphaproteobacteria bacterium]